MKSTLFVLVLFFFCINQSFAQGLQLDWASQTNTDYLAPCAMDANGNIYYTGSFTGTVDFDPESGTVNLSTPNNLEIFLCKMDSSGTLLWAKQLGGTLNDVGYAIALDASANVYVTGSFQGTADFDPSVGTTANLVSFGNADIFVGKYDTDGNYIWAKQLGGVSSEYGNCITVDAAGNVYSSGTFTYTSDFDPSASTTYTLNQFGASGVTDVYVSKLDASGNFVWAKQIGGTQLDYTHSLKIDASTNTLVMAGSFQGTADFDPGTSTTASLVSAGGHDMYIMKLDLSGNYTWAFKIGSVNNDECNAITIDGSGNIYATGYFYNTVDFDPSAAIYNLTALGTNDIFVSKYTSAGNLVWAQRQGNTYGGEYGSDITVDVSGNVYTTGIFTGLVDFDPGAGVYNLTANSGTVDSYICKLDVSGSFVWATNFGGDQYDYGKSILVEPVTNDVYIFGTFKRTADFDPATSVYNLIAPTGFTNLYHLKLSQVAITGIENSSSIEDISISPIPSTGKLTVQFGTTIDDATINVLTITGKKISSQTIQNSSSVEINIDANGFYLLEIYRNTTKETFKVIIQ